MKDTRLIKILILSGLGLELLHFTSSTTDIELNGSDWPQPMRAQHGVTCL